MYFYDINPQSLPRDAEYFFNILTINIAVSQEALDAASLIMELTDYWDVEHLTDPRPYIIHIYVDHELEGGDYDIELCPHTVVEIDPILGLAWYPMFPDDEEQNLWKIV